MRSKKIRNIKSKCVIESQKKIICECTFRKRTACYSTTKRSAAREGEGQGCVWESEFDLFLMRTVMRTVWPLSLWPRYLIMNGSLPRDNTQTHTVITPLQIHSHNTMALWLRTHTRTHTRMHARTHACACMHAKTQTYTHGHTHACTDVHTRMRACTDIHKHMHTHSHTRTHAQTYTHMHARTHAQTCSNTHTRSQTHIDTLAYTHTHIHKHAQTLASPSPRPPSHTHTHTHTHTHKCTHCAHTQTSMIRIQD